MDGGDNTEDKTGEQVNNQISSSTNEGSQVPEKSSVESAVKVSVPPLTVPLSTIAHGIGQQVKDPVPSVTKDSGDLSLPNVATTASTSSLPTNVGVDNNNNNNNNPGPPISSTSTSGKPSDKNTPPNTDKKDNNNANISVSMEKSTEDKLSKTTTIAPQIPTSIATTTDPPVATAKPTAITESSNQSTTTNTSGKKVGVEDVKLSKDTIQMIFQKTK